MIQQYYITFVGLMFGSLVLNLDSIVWITGNVMVIAAVLTAVGLLDYVKQIVTSGRGKNDEPGFGSDEYSNGEASKSLKQELPETINRYREIVEQATDLIYRLDYRGRITYVNPEVTRVTGYTKQELIGRYYMELVHPADYEKVEHFYSRQVITQEAETYLEFRARTKQGQTIWLGQRVRLLKSKGKLVIQAVARDISTRIRTEQQLRTNDEILQLFVKNTPAAVAMVDRNMRYLVVSDRWKEDYEIDVETLVGQSHFDYFPCGSEEWKAIHDRALNGVTQSREEEMFIRKDGSKEWFRCEMHPWREVSGEVGGVIIFTELITRRKEVEKHLKRTKEMAEEASRQKTNFIANMSHELRTPLTGILGYAEVLEHDDQIAPDHKEYLGSIARNGKKLLRMIDEILDISKIDTGRLKFEQESFEVVSLVENCLNSIGDHSGNNSVETRFTATKDIPTQIQTDRGKLHYITTELIENAFKFTPEGTIAVRLSFHPLDNQGVEGLLCLEVEDTGIGIPSGRIDYVKQPFNRIGERYNDGTGMGLTLANRLCGFMGGELEISSEEGKGTTATVHIPVKGIGKSWGQERSLDDTVSAGGNLTTKQVSDFIHSLSEELKETIIRAIEIQDLETLSRIDEIALFPEDKQNGALHKLKSSAGSDDYLFITRLRKEL